MFDLDDDGDDLAEQAEYLTHLSKSADPVLAEQAREALDRLVVKVGPGGYVHGWIHVGPSGLGTRVMHPEHGPGTIISGNRGGRIRVQFHRSRAEHDFEHQFSAQQSLRGDFKPREGAARPAAAPAARPSTLGEWARDRASFYRSQIGKVGPKGYIHGWIHVGAPATGARVLHPEHGHGTVTHHEGDKTHVQFDSGAKHSFEHGGVSGGKEHFKPREDVHARGRNLTDEQRETMRAGRQAQGAGEFDHAIRQAAAHNAKKPLSDHEFAARASRVEKTIGEARKTHSTDVTHMTDGAWNPERVKQHKAIVDSLYAKHAHVPNEGKAVIAGGLGGAGKTTVLKGHAGINPKEWLTVNPDDIKEEMAKRNMVPDVPGHPDLSPMERSALVHEESSHIAQMLADKAYRDKKNMIWDITMSSGDSVQKRIDALHKHGYSNVRGVFVHIPAETSVERAMARYRRGADDHLTGKGLGGRYVPPSVIRAQKTTGGSTVNREVFDKLKPEFDDWSVYDNSGKAPVHVESKG